MSNRTVQAAAEGMPIITRRQALRTLAAGSVAGAVAAGAAALAVPPAAATPVSAIEDLVMQMQAVRELDVAGLTDAQCAANYEVYRACQVRVIELEAQTPRDVALQFLADTDFGDSDWSEEFQGRLFALAGIGGAA